MQVYENGRHENPTIFFFNLHFATRGTKDRQQVMARVRYKQTKYSKTNDITANLVVSLQFLDEVSSSAVMSHPKNPQIRPVASKIFNKFGKEVNDIHDLEYDQEIWLSFGEAWKNPFRKLVASSVCTVYK